MISWAGFAFRRRSRIPEIAAISETAAKLRAKADVVICIGIGGSYLGAKAVLEAMSNPFQLLHKEQQNPTVLFAGQNISGGLHGRAACCDEGALDRSDRDLEIGHDDRTGHRLPTDQGGDREALRQAGGCRTDRGRDGQGARSAEDAGHAGGLPDVRDSGRCGRPLFGADSGRSCCRWP